MLNILFLGHLALTGFCQCAPTVICGDGSTMPLLHPYPLGSLNMMKKTDNLADTTMTACENAHMCAEFCLAECQLCQIMLYERFNVRVLFIYTR